MSDFTIKEGADFPNLQARLKIKDGTTATLTGATVRFSMWLRKDHSLKINRVLATIESATPPADADDPNVSYPWASGDTDTPGEYEGEFEVTYTDSSIEIFPDRAYISIRVGDSMSE